MLLNARRCRMVSARLPRVPDIVRGPVPSLSVTASWPASWQWHVAPLRHPCSQSDNSAPGIIVVTSQWSPGAIRRLRNTLSTWISSLVREVWSLKRVTKNHCLEIAFLSHCSSFFLGGGGQALTRARSSICCYGHIWDFSKKFFKN